MEVWTIAQLKGGVGKTTSAITIARLLNKEHGKRVLLCEVSKQGNIGEFFGYQHENKLEDILLNPEGIKSAICQTDFVGFDYIPATMNLLGVKLEDPFCLQNALDYVASDYDYAVIDCEPSFDMAVIGALMATDKVFMPIKIDQYALDAIEKMRGQIANLQAINGAITLAGVFATMTTNTKYNREELAKLRQLATLPLMKTVIRKSVKVDETSREKKSLVDYAPRCHTSEDYRALVAEMLLL